MPSPVPFYAFSLAKNLGLHDMLNDSFSVALCAAANQPDVTTDAKLSDLTEISYTNLSSRTLTITSATQTAGVFKWVITPKVLSASGGSVATWRYAVIYNATLAAVSPEPNALIALWDYGSNLTLNDTESVTLNFSTSAGLYQERQVSA